jgi:hypothetical protein
MTFFGGKRRAGARCCFSSLLLALLATDLLTTSTATTQQLWVRSSSRPAGASPWPAGAEKVRSFASLHDLRDHLLRQQATRQQSTASAAAAANYHQAAPLLPPLKINLEPGVHRLATPLLLGPDVTGGAQLSIVADPAGGVTTISGGAPVRGWRVSSVPGVLTAQLPPPFADDAPRQLYVDGRRAWRTTDDANSTVAGLGIGATNVTAEGLLTTSVAPLSWPAPAAVEMRHDGSYQQSRCRVLSVTSSPPQGYGGQTLVKMAQPCWRMGLATRQMAIPSSVVNIGGAGRLVAGQWWADEQMLVHYHPRSSDERAGLLAGTVEAEVPVAEGLIAVVDARAISLQGIQFAHAAWAAPDSPDGYLERYGGVRYLSCESQLAKETGSGCYANGTADTASACDAGCCGAMQLGGCGLRMAEAAVSFHRSTRVRVSHCNFTQLGGWGLAVTGASSRVLVSHNHFHDISGGGLYLGNVNETTSAVARHIGRLRQVVVSDNLIEWIGQEYQGSSGIHLFSAVDSILSHNRLAHTPYTSITFVWPVPQSDSWNRNLTMAGNEVSDPSYWGGDGGAVHTLSACTGCHLDGNYFHTQHHGSKCTYIDNGSSGYNITNHVGQIQTRHIISILDCASASCMFLTVTTAGFSLARSI